MSTCWALSSVNREKVCSFVFSTTYAELILALLFLLKGFFIALEDSSMIS